MPEEETMKLEWRDWSNAAKTSNERLLERVPLMIADLEASPGEYCWFNIVGDSFVAVSKRVDGAYSVFTGKVSSAAIAHIT